LIDASARGRRFGAIVLSLWIATAAAQPVMPPRPAMPDMRGPYQAGAPTAGVADRPVAESEANDPYEAFYQRVHRAMREGDFDSARHMLAGVEPLQLPHEGAQLDIAIAMCEVGEREQAFTLFSRLQAGNDVPPAIRMLIDSYVKTGCSRPDRPIRSQLSVLTGYTSNVNYGPGGPLVPLVPGAPVPYLLLMPSQLANPDRFVGLDGSVSWGTAGPEGLNLTVGASIRQYAQRHDYNQAGVSLAAYYGRETKFGTVESQAALGYTWLGARPYQYGGNVQLGYWLPERQFAWVPYRIGFDTSMALASYPDGHAFDARRQEVRLRGRAHIMPNLEFFGALGVIRDTALNDRAGGDRDGYGIVANVSWLPHPRHLVVVLAQHQTLRDREPYFRAFFGDTQRRQVLRQLALRYTYRHAPGLSFYVQGLYQQSDDSIAMFRYQAGSVSTGVLMDF